MQEQPKNVNTTNARERMLAGVKVGYDVVSSTFGPRSANVAIKRPFGAPSVIHDGVNAFRSIFPLPDDEMNTGAEIAFGAAEKTNNSAGDGTTNATILTYEIASEAHKRITAGARPMALREGIETAAAAVVAELDKMKRPIKAQGDKAGEVSQEILMVATISAQVPDIGQMVADAYAKLGPDAILTVEESPTEASQLDLKEGMQFDKGWITPYFVDPGNKHGEAVLEKAQLIVTDMHIRDLEAFHEMMQRIIESGVKHLAIIASGFDIPIMSYFVKNHLKGAFKGILIEAPAHGEKRLDLLRDIAIVTGAKFLSEGAGEGLESVDASYLGNTRRIVSTKDTTLIVDGEGSEEDINHRVEEIKGQLTSPELSAFDREKLKERLARLHSGIGVLTIGAKSEPEMKERKERAIDAISAARAALSDGIIPGGGIALKTAATKARKQMKKQLDSSEFDFRSGAEVVFAACERPFRKLMSNAGYDPGEYSEKLSSKPEGHGVDVVDGQILDMIEAGIIDPALVIKSAVGHATSAAVSIFTSESLVTDYKESK